MSEKPLIFLSHIHEEKDLAISLKQLIESVFPHVEVFVSSDESSNSVGNKWLSIITAALKKCKIEIILCSKFSVTRPWINFEAGAGWVREISVIPVCHSDMSPKTLPIPLNELHAVNLKSNDDLKKLFYSIAKDIDCRNPNKDDFSDFINSVNKFEDSYLFWDVFTSSFPLFERGFIESIKNGELNKKEYNLTETEINQMNSSLVKFNSYDLLKFERLNKRAMMDLSGNKGIIYACTVEPTKKLQQVLTDNRSIGYQQKIR